MNINLSKESKAYVAEKIGDKYIIPTIGVWDKFEDIDFDSLPKKTKNNLQNRVCQFFGARFAIKWDLVHS